MEIQVGHNKGIPTRYKGRNYRSRLEARWACFFDLLGWRYEYEPCDFEGWIPDFVLCEAVPVFVEVKPVTTFPEDVAAEIDATSCCEEALIVGVGPLRGLEWNADAIGLGWLGEVMLDGGKSWGEAAFGVWTPRPGTKPRVGFCHVIQRYSDRITGVGDGGRWGALHLDTTGLLSLWAEAGNVTQWRAPKGLPHAQ